MHTHANTNIELEIVWVARTQIRAALSPNLSWVTLLMDMMWCEVMFGSSSWMWKANSHVGLSDVLTKADMTCGKLLTRLNYFVSNQTTSYDSCLCDLMRGALVPNSHTIGITNVRRVDYLLGYTFHMCVGYMLMHKLLCKYIIPRPWLE